MSIKLEASDKKVIDYLKELWNSNFIDEDIPVEEEEVELQLEQDNNIDEKKEDLTEFKKEVKSKLQALRDVGFRVYHNIGLEKEVNLQPKTVTDNDIDKVHTYKIGTYLTRKQLMTNIAKCTVFPKYKSGLITEPSNFRYLVNHHNTIKILDRMWVLETIQKMGANIPDPEIYKSNLVKNFSPSIIHTAIKNTFSIDSIILLDITRAFDSLEWDILEELLLANLTRKTNSEIAKEIVSQYMVILRNRELYYNNIIVPISKGIPTGLPSSNLVFTLALEEILFRWMNTYGYTNNREFMLNVYVDDIYIKIMNLLKTKDVVTSLIEFLAKYKLYVNKTKSKASYNLDLIEFNELKETDYYLGIPFTRNKQLYGELILKEFQKNKLNLSWETIYNKLSSDDKNDDNVPIIFGFMNYKLKPIMNNNPDINTNKVMVSKFINDNYIKKTIIKRLSDCFWGLFKFF
jgi:hypothetical protein